MKLLTIEEVAEILKVSDRTVHRWLQEGKFKAYKIGRLLRIKESDLHTFVNSKGE